MDIQPTVPVIGGLTLGIPVFLTPFIPQIRLFFVGVLFLFLFIYAATMIFGANDESAKTESKLAYAYAAAGAVVVSIAGVIANFASPAGGEAVNPGLLRTPLENILAYGKLLLATALVANITIQGFRLISSGGEQEYVDRARKRLVMGFIGAILVLLSDVIAGAVNGGTLNSGILNDEMIGIANFILVLLGGTAVLGVIIAGIMLVVSVEESLKDKAKTLIKTSIIVMVVVLVSYTFVSTILSAAGS